MPHSHGKLEIMTHNMHHKSQKRILVVRFLLCSELNSEHTPESHDLTTLVNITYLEAV